MLDGILHLRITIIQYNDWSGVREDYIYELILIMWKDVRYDKDKEFWALQIETC